MFQVFQRHAVSNQRNKWSPHQLWAVIMDELNCFDLILLANNTAPCWEITQSFLQTIHAHVFHGLLYLYLPLKPCTIAHFSPTVHSSNSRSRKSNRLKNIYNVSYHIMTFTISFTQVSNKIPPFLAALPPQKGSFWYQLYPILVQTNHPPSKARSCLRWWGRGGV